MNSTGKWIERGYKFYKQQKETGGMGKTWRVEKAL